MPHALTELNLAEVTRPASQPAHEIRADVCVVGAGIAGLSAAIQAGRQPAREEQGSQPAFA
jgi:NADPH-dependent 2,4-dienoyl-CoA reductase/sulfur reductase-like enzyme